MNDLISRKAAIDAINHICPVDTEYDCTLLDRVDVRYVLSDLPSAEPKKGRWIFAKYFVWECSECGKNPTKGMGYTQGRSELFRYCPYCGAKMSEIPTDLESEDKE